ncbi:hypothetical protein BU23DRAFT_545039 [Bimuria novae-zelandiae CBS 107.79]|uniref:Uncharacterized protein n=1 Tax=Bimuria novae-zelandiae CBS 107.79 TaxID=1447943 RepID=A0A6A5UY52_9PLEO|nr:hypothetical protein BU23DRAFT_545039 [Bimuria novae-zelandiae CBS 107.79]
MADRSPGDDPMIGTQLVEDSGSQLDDGVADPSASADAQVPGVNEAQVPTDHAPGTQMVPDLGLQVPTEDHGEPLEDDVEAGVQGQIIRQSVEGPPDDVMDEDMGDVHPDGPSELIELMDGIENGAQEMEGIQDSQVHIDGVNGDEDSLFVPDERVPSSAPGPSVRHFMAPPRFAGLSATPGPSTQPSSSRMAPPPAPTSPSATRPPGSVFSRIRKLQVQINKAKRPMNRPTQAVQPASGGDTYMEVIFRPRPGREALVGVPTVDEGEKADREAAAKFAKEKKRFDTMKKKKGGKLSFAEDIEWMRIYKAELERQNKRKRDLAMASEERGETDLFPDEFETGIDRSEDDPQEPMFDGDPAGSRKRKGALGGNSMQEAELRSMQVALQANGDRPGKKKKGASMPDNQEESSTGRGRGRPKGSKSKASGSSSGSRTRAGVRKPTAKDKAKAVRMGNSLMNFDVFRQQAGDNAPEEATFTARNKQDALKELIASVPIEHQKSARDDKAALLRDSKDFDGHGACRPAPNGMWKVKGMKTTLKNYQVMGTAFMRRRERAAEKPKGGLMADQMGLGKTLMMLANIVNGRADKNASCKTTLLVASPALLAQWADEIKLHTDAGLKVMRYTSGSRIDSTHAFAILQSHDIIMTTYHEVMKSYPRNDPPIHCQTAQQKLDWWKVTYENERGPLHRLMFYRIVLDEAQAIKNHTSRTSIACRALMAKHKWALSGTPILNSLDELYSYFKFLEVPYTGNFKIFKHNYTDSNDPENIERLLARLLQFMIRRDHSDVLFNKPILKLPQASKMTHWCTFNPVERSIYEIVRQRFARRINFHVKNSGLEKSYSNALVMLLRLRQLTAHLLMLQYVVQDLLEHEDIEKIHEVVHQEASSGRNSSGDTILMVRKQLDQLETHAKKRSTQEAANGSKGSMGPRIPAAFDDEEEEQRDIEEILGNSPEADGASQDLADDRHASGRTFGKTFDFRPFLNSLTHGDNWERIKKRAKCGDCEKRPHRAWLTSCGHLLCGPCYDIALILAAEENRPHGMCLGCGSVFQHATELNKAEIDALQVPMTRAKKKQHSKVVQDIEQQDIAEDWLNIGRGGVLPSAKTIALKAQLLNWFTENPNVKIIIYTQFLAMIRIIAKMCQEEGWLTEQYHGKMSQGARDKAIKDFANNGRVRVLLASLRCGGLGLNLTMASRVVILDPWWNASAEQQAFCRVFRFGQEEPTFLTRFCVKTSVDERLIEMQDIKQKHIDSVMEDDGSKVKKLSTRDLMRLFGNVGEDDQGNPYILIDNPDPRGGFYADRDHEGYADEL